MGTTTNPPTEAEPLGHLSRLETEMAVLARTLERMSRQSLIHADVDRSSYLLARTLSAEGATSIGGLAERLGLDATTVTRQVATMEAAGLVARRTDPDDGRVRLIELTGPGEDRMRGVQQAREARFEELIADWSIDDRERFGLLLGRLNDALLDRSPTG